MAPKTGATALGFRAKKGAAPDPTVAKVEPGIVGTGTGTGAAALAKGLTAAAEAKLREFDLDSRFGPCMSPVSRRARWERAQALGLNPPAEILELLGGKGVRQKCLWFGRV